MLSVDNHNSVNGIREFVRRAGADVVYAHPSLRQTCGWMTSGWFSCWTNR
jgi:hypothetical protein